MKIMIYYCNENPRLDLKSYAKEWLWLHYSLCVYVSTLRWRNVTIADFLCHSLTILNVNTAIFLYISVSKHIKKHIFHIQICIFCQLYCISFYVYHMKHLFWNVVTKTEVKIMTKHTCIVKRLLKIRRKAIYILQFILTLKMYEI